MYFTHINVFFFFLNIITTYDLLEILNFAGNCIFMIVEGFINLATKTFCILISILNFLIYYFKYNYFLNV